MRESLSLPLFMKQAVLWRKSDINTHFVGDMLFARGLTHSILKLGIVGKIASLVFLIMKKKKEQKLGERL